jgi:hypothetical protein
LDAKPAEIEPGGVEHVHVGFARVAVTGAHFANLEGTAKQPDQFPARILGKLERTVANDKILAFGRDKPMLAGERDMAVGTGRPRNRSDSGGFSTGYGIVRYPCRQRSITVRIMAPSPDRQSETASHIDARPQ